MNKNKMYILGGLVAVVLLVIVGGLLIGKDGVLTSKREFVDNLVQYEKLKELTEKKIFADMEEPRGEVTAEMIAESKAAQKEYETYPEYSRLIVEYNTLCERFDNNERWMSSEQRKKLETDIDQLDKRLSEINDKCFADASKKYSQKDIERANKDIESIVIAILKTYKELGGVEGSSIQRVIPLTDSFTEEPTAAIKRGPIEQAFHPKYAAKIEEILGKKLSEMKDPWGQTYVISSEWVDKAHIPYQLLSVSCSDRNDEAGRPRIDPFATKKARENGEGEHTLCGLSMSFEARHVDADLDL